MLDSHVSNGSQEIAKPIVTNFVFREFLKFLFLFTLLYIIRVKKHILFNKFVAKKTANLTGRTRWRL